ncbi:MAG: hypothetical protein R2704_19145 [Microthrixaceae bacterium]
MEPRRGPMSPTEARAVLGVSGEASLDDVRAAFRRQIGRHHPDVSSAGGTPNRAIRLIEAWEVLRATPDGEQAPASPGGSGDDAARPPSWDASGPGTTTSGPAPPPGAATDAPASGMPAAWATGASVMAAAPADETMLWLIDAAHRIGDVTFLDASAGLVEALVEFVDGPTVTLTMSLQGRAPAGTEVFVSMEPWSTPPRPDLPDDASVARLLAHHLNEAAAELDPKPDAPDDRTDRGPARYR